MEKTFKLPHIPSELYDRGAEVINILKGKGHKAFMVGGCVRDMALDIPPTEYDIATSALPDEVIDIFPHTVPIGKSFGVVLVIHLGFQFEVATFRTEESYTDGRRPDSVLKVASEERMPRLMAA